MTNGVQTFNSNILHGAVIAYEWYMLQISRK